MRILTIIAGILLTILGVFSVANAGLSFLSLAFPIGVVLVLVGLVECLVYKRIMQDEENRQWVLIEGLTTFVLGIVVLTGQLARGYRRTRSIRAVVHDIRNQRLRRGGPGTQRG